MKMISLCTKCCVLCQLQNHLETRKQVTLQKIQTFRSYLSCPSIPHCSWALTQAQMGAAIGSSSPKASKFSWNLVQWQLLKVVTPTPTNIEQCTCNFITVLLITVATIIHGSFKKWNAQSTFQHVSTWLLERHLPTLQHLEDFSHASLCDKSYSCCHAAWSLNFSWRDSMGLKSKQLSGNRCSTASAQPSEFYPMIDSPPASFYCVQATLAPSAHDLSCFYFQECLDDRKPQLSR